LAFLGIGDLSQNYWAIQQINRCLTVKQNTIPHLKTCLCLREIALAKFVTQPGYKEAAHG
jgi:uncharacterized membrane protein YwzB